MNKLYIASFFLKATLTFENLFKDLNINNSVSICLRQNRFSEGVGKKSTLNIDKSVNFTNEQINYINKSVELIKSKINNPTFFL